jgi:DNA polymerase-1
MSLAYRAWFALPPDLATKDGTVTNAVHGFVSMLVYVVREHRPSALAVAFDLPGPTFRDDLVADYKAGRPQTPDDLLPQFELIRQVLSVLAIPVVEVPGYEADDVLATLATEARDRDCDAVVVTGDRDCFQLVEDPHLRVLYNRRGVSDYALYDEAGIVERSGVSPAKYPMLAALRGDASDNLPGVPGVGEKTAARLLNTYGDLDGIFSHLDELSPKLRQNLAAHEAQARSNAAITLLVRDVPVPVSVADLDLGGWDLDVARATFDRLELRTVWRRLVGLLEDGALGDPAPGTRRPVLGAETTEPDGTLSVAAVSSVRVPEPDAFGDGSASAGPVPGTVVRVELEIDHPTTEADAVDALVDLAGRVGQGRLAVAGRWDGVPARSALRGLALVAGQPPERALWVEAPLLEVAGVRRTLSQVLGRGGIVGHHVKELLRTLLPLGVAAGPLDMDTAVAAYLLDPSTGDYGLEAVAGPWLAAEDASGGTVAPAPGPPLGQLALDKVDPVVDGAPSAAEAGLILQLAGPLRQSLRLDGLEALHDQVETPLVGVLARMEVAGIAVDEAELRRIADELVADTAALEAEIHRLAGHEFNVNSTPQLRTVLYDELKLTPGRKTKTGFSTDAATLESLRDDHPVVDTLLRYREVEKLRSTYGEALLGEVAPDGRIHASFRQTVARTGRLSSERPNLHNIPVRTEAGRRFRRAFVPAPGSSFLVADYDQIELRVIAHLSGDPGLVAAFTSGADVHRTVAAGVYGVPPEEVTYEQRERAKMVSYGLAYGMEAFGLARRLSTGVEEANEIMDRYFGAFPSVRQYMEDTVAEARARGYTRTALGRKRPLPELADRNYRVRQAAERQAMNAGIQGLAADLFKTALVRLDAALAERSLASRLVLQIHDEVIVETAAGEEADVEALTTAALTGAAELSVPLKVSLALGPSWAAAKGG